MFESLREKIAEWFLKRQLDNNPRKVVAKNLQQIRSVGILFNIDEESTYKIVKNYVRFLREEGVKTVKAVGYYEEKEFPHYLQPSLEFDFIGRKELNWYLKPVGTTANNFSEINFDVLIDLSGNRCLPVLFLCSTSPAGMKIGKYSEKYQYLYDFMIDLAQKKTLSYYLEQVTYYLKLINKNEP